ncbi:MAG: hypothetical protein JST59_16090 [Actinobacteria bacterium]|nr:hypothetical protein [Actinomycetota bacterium]
MAGPDEREAVASTATLRDLMVKMRGGWRAEILARVLELGNRLEVVPDRVPTGAASGWGFETAEGVRKEIKLGVRRELDAAVAAVNRHGLKSWWTGYSITEAWEYVHNAELSLLRVESDDWAAAFVPRLRDWLERTMDAGDLRKEHEATLKAVEAAGPSKLDRTKVGGVMADVIEANNRRYAGVRTFRNNLILITGMLVALLVVIATWHNLNTDFISLCAKSDGKTLTECMDGKKAGPHGTDIWMVLLLGALGGLLSIAFGFTDGEDSATRFDPRTWQAFLKPATGAATALIAVLLLQSKLLLEPADPSQATFLAYAAIFGFSQQLLTHFVDKRADSLIKPDAK